jgi:acetylglutamate kinase
MREVVITNQDRAEVLIHALPYIQRYMGKTMVVKYGGNAMINGDLKAAVIQDVILMNCVGIRTILVNGGGPEIETMWNMVARRAALSGDCGIPTMRQWK